MGCVLPWGRFPNGRLSAGWSCPHVTVTTQAGFIPVRIGVFTSAPARAPQRSGGRWEGRSRTVWVRDWSDFLLEQIKLKKGEENPFHKATRTSLEGCDWYKNHFFSFLWFFRVKLVEKGKGEKRIICAAPCPISGLRSPFVVGKTQLCLRWSLRCLLPSGCTFTPFQSAGTLVPLPPPLCCLWSPLSQAEVLGGRRHPFSLKPTRVGVSVACPQRIWS